MRTVPSALSLDARPAADHFRQAGGEGNARPLAVTILQTGVSHARLMAERSPTSGHYVRVTRKLHIVPAWLPANAVMHKC